MREPPCSVYEATDDHLLAPHVPRQSTHKDVGLATSDLIQGGVADTVHGELGDGSVTLEIHKLAKGRQECGRTATASNTLIPMA